MVKTLRAIGSILVIIGLIFGGGLWPVDDRVSADEPEGMSLPQFEPPKPGNPKLDSQLDQLVSAGVNRLMTFSVEGGPPAEIVQVVIECQPGTADEVIARAAGCGAFETSYENLVQMTVPVSQLSALAELTNIEFVRLPYRPVEFAISEGKNLINADKWHTAGFTGTGVKIGILDVGFYDYNTRLSEGEVPDPVETKWSGSIGQGASEHGTACTEVAYDIAPGANYYLANVNTDIEWLNAVDWLIQKQVNVISCSIGNFAAEPEVYAKVAEARAAGIIWSQAAGNAARSHWYGNWTDTDSDGYLNFPAGWEIIPVYVIHDYPLDATLKWDDSWGASSHNFGLLLFYWNDSSKKWEYVTQSDDPQNGDDDPVENIYYPVSSAGFYGLAVYSASPNPLQKLHVFVYPYSFGVTDLMVAERSVCVPGDSPNVMTVGAVPWNNPSSIEPFSSQGPTDGGQTKPDLVASDNVTNMTINPFTGTSAAAPHAAGAAALVKQRYPAYTPDQIQAFLEGRAFGLGASGKDNVFGSGRLDLQAFPPLASPQVTTGDANGITGDSAVLNGSLTSLGEYSSADVSFEWGTVSGALDQSTLPVAKAETGDFSATISGLTPNTPYYYRAKGTADSITAYGSEAGFTTAELDVLRDLPDPVAVVQGQTFQVTVNFTATADEFNSIVLYDEAPADWQVAGDITWCTPDAQTINLLPVKIEYSWPGPYSQGQTFTAVYEVTVPADAPAGAYTFGNGHLIYYIAATEHTVGITGEFQVTVQDITPPAVNAVEPADAAVDVPFDSVIQVTFSEPMNHDSVEGAFSILPSVTGLFGWADNTMTFDPDTPLASNTPYTANISTGAQDIAGNPLATEYSWSFTTAKTVPAVTSGAATSVGTDSAMLNMTYNFADYGSGQVRFGYKQDSEQDFGYTDWVDMSASGTYSETINGLTSNTTYIFYAQLQYQTTVIDGQEMYFTTADIPPSAPVIDVTPDTPLTINDLVCTVTTPSIDPDSSTVYYTYEWYKGEALQQTTANTTSLTDTLSATLTTKGETWKCVVTPNDGMVSGAAAEDQVTIGNTPPAAPVINITPGEPLSGADLVCNIITPSTDDDSDPVTYTYEWYTGEDLQQTTANTTSLSDTVTSNLTMGNETWKCVVTPNDGTADGPFAEDQVVIIPEVWVDDNWAGSDSGNITPGGHIFGIDAFATIQEGVAFIEAGGTVTVHDGTYSGNMTVDKGITIRSVSGAAATTLALDLSSSVNVTADNVEINGFTISGTGQIGIYINQADYCYIHDCIVMGFEEGIYLENTDSSRVNNNTVKENAYGIVILDSQENEVLGNNIIDNVIYAGIRLVGDSIGNAIKFNNITGNAVLGMGADNISENISAHNNWWGSAGGPGGAGPGTGDNVTEYVDYTPWLTAEVSNIALETVTDDTLSALAEADTEVEITGSANVTVAEYAGNPGGGFSGDLGKYIDVNIDDVSGVTGIEIRLYYTAAEITGKEESTLKLKWWDGDSWENCSNTSVNTTDVNGYSGYIRAIINSSTTPTLTQLVGTPFGAAASPVVTPTPTPTNPPSVGGGGGGGGGGSSGADGKTITSLRGSSSSTGVVWANIQAVSMDTKCTVDIPYGTKCTNANGYALTSVTITELRNPDAAQTGVTIIGMVYELGPKGSGFDPYATLTIKYNEASIPAGITESSLQIAIWDTESKTYKAIDCEVDTAANKIQASINHFSRYTIITVPAATTTPPSTPTTTTAPKSTPAPVPVSTPAPTSTPALVPASVLPTTPTPAPAVSTTAPTITTPVAAIPIEKTGNNWPLIGGIIGGVIVAGLLVLVIRRYRRD